MARDGMSRDSFHITDQEALLFHASGRPGKLEITPTKPLTTQRDLSLAYSPGVAAPCRRIAEDPTLVYDYTAKGNLVAIISNGTAVLGLGDLGAAASKPVMEGKAVLFKRFADIDGIDIEVSTSDVDEFVNCVRYIGATFGGINLEDIKAPECFVVEQRLRELLDIPVFHDDQHGTAIITAAGFLNALDLTGRDIADVRIVFNGAGAAGIACIELIKAMGLPHGNAVMCDRRGVIYQGREEGMNQWKSAHAVETEARTLAEALEGADAFVGLSVKGAVTQDMVASMAKKPIIFAMANPDPEIAPEEVRAVRADAIIATGRSDYPNQVNNVLGFPYIFRGALDVRASTINDDMKIAAVRALAALAREDVPDEVAAAYSGQRLRYGPEYIIPAPFDPRLMTAVASAVAQAAMSSGVARKPIIDMDAYQRELSARLDPTSASLRAIFERVRSAAARVVFAEGESETVVRAAVAFANAGYGIPILIGHQDRVPATMAALGLERPGNLEILDPGAHEAATRYIDFLYERMQRKGTLHRDCERMVSQNSIIFAACMVACDDADAMVCGVTQSYWAALEEITRVIDPEPDQRVFGFAVMVARDRTVFIADTAIHEVPTAEELADIAVQSAAKAHRLGQEPRIAFLSYSSFGNPLRKGTDRIRAAVEILDRRLVDFEYDGEMSTDVALDHDLMQQLYPFCRLSGPANVLIMPALNSASISSKLLQMVGGGTVIGPLLTGLARPVQIAPMRATVSDVVNLAALAAYDAVR